MTRLITGAWSVCFAVLCFLAFGCKPDVNPHTLQVGVIMPLTGNVASLGVPCFNGMKLALKEFNQAKSASARIEFIPEDTNADATTAVAAFTKLATINHAIAILGPLTSTEALAVAPIAERNRLVMISPGASTPALTSAGEYIFRNELSDLKGGAAQATLAFGKMGFRRMAALYMNNAYGVGLVRVFQDTFASLGGSIVSTEAFQPDTVDFRSHLSKIKAAKPNAVLVIAVDEIVNIIRQAKELGLDIPIFTTPIFENETYIKQLGPLADGVLYVYYGTFNSNATDSRTQHFTEAYKHTFDNEAPTYYSALGYDAANLLFAALSSSGLKPDDLRKHLHAIRDYPGVTGPSSFDSHGDIEKPVLLKTVAKGRFVIVP
jgi:branched-chain amino acid transport system substrate-binding protein